MEPTNQQTDYLVTYTQGQGHFARFAVIWFLPPPPSKYPGAASAYLH